MPPILTREISRAVLPMSVHETKLPVANSRCPRLIMAVKLDTSMAIYLTRGVRRVTTRVYLIGDEDLRWEHGRAEGTCGGNESPFSISAKNIKVCAIVISAGIEEFFLPGKRKLAIQKRGVPGNVTGHDHVGKGVPFMISVRAQTEIREAVTNVEGKLKTIIGDDELAIHIDTT